MLRPKGCNLCGRAIGQDVSRTICQSAQVAAFFQKEQILKMLVPQHCLTDCVRGQLGLGSCHVEVIRVSKWNSWSSKRRGWCLCSQEKTFALKRFAGIQRPSKAAVDRVLHHCALTCTSFERRRHCTACRLRMPSDKKNITSFQWRLTSPRSHQLVLESQGNNA